MGIDCHLKEAFRFTYSKNLGGGMSEREYDHVFLGIFEGALIPDQDEVATWRWVELDALAQDVARNSGLYTFWFQLTLVRILNESTLRIVDSLEACGQRLDCSVHRRNP